jgi:hypothetical protein
MVESLPQHTAGAVPAPSVVVGVDATLLAARQLLNNPPPSGASPSVAEEWRRNVDQLVIAAINTPLHERRCQPSAQYCHTPPVAHAPSAARAPPVEHAPPVGPDARQTVRHRAPMASYAMADLRAEINRRHGGEDGRVTIERQHERHQDIEGRNLEKDFDSYAPLHKGPSAREAHPPSSPGVTGGGGCMALAPHLRMVVWPRKFRAHLPKKYDGTVNPAEFLQIYSTSILAAGGDEAIMANYFPVALTGTARSWLMNLPEGTLDSWPELCCLFTANFESAYAWPGNETDLHAVLQRPGESLRSFIQRFSQVRNIIPRISNASVVVAFRQGVRDKKMLEKLAAHDIQDVSALFSLADKCARAAVGHAWHSPAAPASKEASKPNAGTTTQGVGDKSKKKKKAGSSQSLAGAPTAAAAAAAAGGGRGAQRGDKRPHQPSNSDEGGAKCQVHNSTRHTASECWEIKKLMEQFREKM